MVIDVSSLLATDARSTDVSLDLSPDRTPEGVTALPGGRLEGRVTDTGGYVRLTSKVSVPYRTVCGRCLKPVNGVLEFDFDRTLVTPGQVSEEVLEENPDEYLFIENGCVEIDDALYESVLLEFPMTILCDPDCPGLCPVCGKRLSPGETCCRREKPRDPRLEALRSFVDGEDDDQAPEKE